MKKNPVQTLLLIVLLTLLYFAAGRLGLRLAIVHPQASLVWPPTGLALAASLLFGYRVWPGIFLGAFWVNVSTSGNVFLASTIGVGNTLEALVGAYLVNRYANGSQVFTRSFDVFKFFLLACLMSTAISATFGVSSLALANVAEKQNYLSIWLNWWFGNATGVLLLTPPLVLWRTHPLRQWSLKQIVEGALILIISMMIGMYSFLDWRPFGIGDSPIGFGILPLVVWTAFRFGPTGTTTITLLLSSLAVMGMLRGFGTTDQESLNSTIWVVQIFMDTVALSGLVLATVVNERRRVTLENERLYQEAQALNAELEARVNQRTEALERAQAEASALNRSLLTARETERTEIAREIHDQLGQQLTLLSFDLTTLQEQITPQSEAVQERLASMAELLQETSTMVRNLATQLRPSMLDELGLLSTLRWQLQEFETRTGITSQLKTHLNDLALTPETATALFRVCQEALTNVVRHAQATHVEISCELLNAYLVLEIRDNGKGIAAHEKIPTQSFGLLGMRERVHLIGGELDIYGINHQGTTICVRVPWSQA